MSQQYKYYSNKDRQVEETLQNLSSMAVLTAQD